MKNTSQNNTLFYLANWSKDKTKTWSGTTWGLFVALGEIFKINNIDLSKRTLFQRLINKVFKSNDMGVRNHKYARKKLLRLFNSDKKNIVFQFEEIIHNNSFLNTYLYIDLSVSYVKYLYDNLPEIFSVSGFEGYSESAIYKRMLSQNHYFDTCSGILTMGEWLKDDLIHRCNVPENKIFHVGGGINLDVNLIDDTNKCGNKILFVGRDFKRKGGVIVFNAFKILKQKMPDLELYVAGPAENPINEKIDGYNYMGDCSHDKLSELFNKCDIFCMPSYFEAYGLVFVEHLCMDYLV